MHIWDLNQIDAYFPVQYIGIVTKADREIVKNVFKRKKKSKERAIQCRQQKKKNLDRSIEKCDEPTQIGCYALGSYHLRDSSLGSTAGMQCSCIALFALCRSAIRKYSA